MTDPILKAQLVRDEGRDNKSYLDSEGFWTVGIGHYLGLERRILWLTDEEVEAFYTADVAEAMAIVFNIWPELGAREGKSFELWADANGPVYRALVNMAFNLGETKLREFKKFRAAVSAYNWNTAAVEMMDSKWAKQVGARATRLRDQIRTGKDVV